MKKITLLLLLFTISISAQFTETIDGLTVNFTAQYYDCGYDTQFYNWDYGDGTTETINCDVNASHTYATVGNYYVCLNMTDSYGDNGTECKTITVVDNTTGIQENTAIGFSFFPNPVNNTATISFNRTKKNIDIIVYNTLGMTVWNKKYFNKQVVNLDFSNLNNGVYLMVTKVNGKERIDKFIKK